MLSVTEMTVHAEPHEGRDPATGEPVYFDSLIAVPWRGCRSTYTHKATLWVVECDEGLGHEGRHRGRHKGMAVAIDWSDSMADKPATCESTYPARGRHVRCAEPPGHEGVHRALDPEGGSDHYWQDVLPEVARDTQVGGNHYRKFRIQVWDIWQEYGLDAFTGTVVKYLLRAGHKGDKLEDLKKARQTLDRLIEIEEGKV